MTLQDKYFKAFVDQIKQTNEALFGIKEALTRINDQNILHRQCLERNTDKLGEMAFSNKSLIKIFQWVIISLVSALIVLAGAEKIIKAIPLL